MKINGRSSIALGAAIDALPWQPISPGFSLKVVRGGRDDDTRVLVLRVEPGTVIGRHRHSGEIHALNLAGARKILDSGLVIGPGDYVYEPPGNVDSWMAIGDEPAIVFLTARGSIEYLGEKGEVLSRTTTESVTDGYRQFVDAQTVAARAYTRCE
jgi:2,4'-dihydroxyacetophenone dioxygenase